MRNIRTTVFAGIAALAAVGAAVAASDGRHVMNVDLPDGSVARIEYKGDLAPKLTVAPALNIVPVHWFDPFVAAPFTSFDRIAADMDRQTDLLMQQASSLQPNARDGKVDLAAFGALPRGTVSYSVVSTGTRTGTCSRSVEVVSFGPGRPPKVVSSSSGDCPAVSSITAGPRGTDQGGPSTPGRTQGDRAGKPLPTT